MASRGAIAAMTDGAIKRIQASAARLGEHTGVQPVTLETRRYGDPDYERAQLLERIATWIEQITDATVNAPEDEPPGSEGYDAFTIAQLKDMAQERGIDLQGATRKGDIIAALELADEESVTPTEDADNGK
jgi:hypothetical protein